MASQRVLMAVFTQAVFRAAHAPSISAGPLSDLRTILENLDDQDDLNRELNAAVTQAVKDSLEERLRDLI